MMNNNHNHNQNHLHNQNHHNNMMMHTNTSSNSSSTEGFELVHPPHPSQMASPLRTIQDEQKCVNHSNPQLEAEEAANGRINNNNNNNGRFLNQAELKTNEDEKAVIACEPFKPHKPKQPGLRANVFVSKDCTRDLAEHIVEESWGSEYGMLYKYLDYIFRCQIFDQQVKKITYSTSDEIVVFHTGLQRRDDHNFLYFVLKPNDHEKRNAEQRWRVPAGCIRDWCISREELLSGKWCLSEAHLPKRTKFYSNLQELLFDESYEIEVNWQERLRTNKERISQELKNNTEKTPDRTKLVSELTEQFEAALKKAANRAKANPRLAVAQGFVETKHYKKRVELLLPLKVEYPRDSGKLHTFALALRKVENAKKYTGMSLLTMSMAYANARLVGYVDSSWLINDVANNSNKKDRRDKDKHKDDKERESTHNSSPPNSQSNNMKPTGYVTGPQQFVYAGPYMIPQSKSGVPRMTFQSPQSIQRSRSGGGSRNDPRIGQSLPASFAPAMIPEDENIPPMEAVILPEDAFTDNAPLYDIQTAPMYQNKNHPYYAKSQQQPMHSYGYAQPQHAYIDDQSELSDANPPLSQFDVPQHANNKAMGAGTAGHGYKSGLGAVPTSNLKYSRSAFPVLTSQNEPELHHKIEDDVDDDPIQNEPLADLQDDALQNAPLQIDDVAVMDPPGNLGFSLDHEVEQEIQNLRYHRSEPAIKSTPKLPATTGNTSNKSQMQQTSSMRQQFNHKPPVNASKAAAPSTQPGNKSTAAATKGKVMSRAYITQYYRANPVAKLPKKVQKYAQPTTQQYGVVPYMQTNYGHHSNHNTHNNGRQSPTDNRSVRSTHSDPSSQKYLLQLSRLPGDCGVNTLRHIFTASGCSLQSVHLVDDDKIAVVRFPDQKALNIAAEFVKQFQWHSQIIEDSPYLKNYDQQDVWQYQVSTKWNAHHPDMAKLIDQIPPRTDVIIEHGQRRYFIEKYNKQQGRQTNVRTRNQRMIRRIRIHVWATKTNPIFAKAIPRIVPDPMAAGQPQFAYVPKQNTAKQPDMNTMATANMYDGLFYDQPSPPVPAQAALPSMAGLKDAANAGFDPHAPEFVPNVNVSPAFGGNMCPTRTAKPLKVIYARSQPPVPSLDPHSSLNQQQLLTGDQMKKANPASIVYDKMEYKYWQILDADDDPESYGMLTDQCCTDKFSGVWWYVPDTNTRILQKYKNSKNYRKEDGLCYIPDADDAKCVFDNGGFNASQGLQENICFFDSVKSAFDFCDKEHDDNNNVKIFICDVFLTPNQQREYKQKGEVNVQDVAAIQLAFCVSINIHILTEALDQE